MMTETPRLLIEHQRAMSPRLDYLERQIQELRVTWWQRGIKRLIILARGHLFLSDRATSWLFWKVKWLRWS